MAGAAHGWSRAAAGLAVFLSLLLAAPALADPSSLYRGPGPRPGPNILYQPVATSPQLQNTGIWRAPPILVSGTSAYRTGEFLYQDFLYDDHGANSGQRDQNDPRSNSGTSGDLFSSPNGDYTYPTDPAYAMNAADFVELRVKPLADATAFRITLNTMKDPSLVGTTIALGGTPLVDHMYPDGANVTGPAEFFVTVHGTSVRMVNAVGLTPTAVQPTVTVDTARRQIEVRVPHSAWDPTGQTKVRLAAGVGLWDKAKNRYLIPQPNADTTHPGGAGNLSNPPAFFNVAFRWQTGPPTDAAVEPMPLPNDQKETTSPSWWRDRAQGEALKTGDMSPFFAMVDFTKLAAGANDDMAGQPHGVPQTGPMDRVLASHFETEQGVDYSALCGGHDCPGEYRGRLQPYAIYIPAKAPPASGYGLTLQLHSLSANYNQYLSSKNESQFGDRSTGSIIITPEGRGPDGWYFDAAGADTFEVWADVASRYHLDPAYTAISGYSMGGYGTYKLATQYPDLFAKGQPVVGPPAEGIWAPPTPPTSGDETNTNRMLASLRNIPFMMWVQVTDELVPFAGTEAQARTFDSLGYRYDFRAHTPGEHLTLAINDEYQPAADFLGSDRVNRDPAHVTYVVNPTMDFPAVATVADHAYWLSGMRLRDGSGSAPLGTFDVRSEGFGVGDPQPNPTQFGGGALTGGTIPAIAYQEQSRDWGTTPAAPKADRLDITATNVSSVTIAPKRARVDCDAQLNVKSDGPLTVILAGCGRRATFTRAGGCDASRPPRASISRAGVHASRARGVGLSGRAIAFRCVRGRSARGSVKRVNVEISRAAGKRCRFLTRSGAFTAPRSCTRPVGLRARMGRARGGKVPWTFRLRHRLPAGRYVATARAVDSKGHVQRSVGRFNRRQLFVR